MNPETEREMQSSYHPPNAAKQAPVLDTQTAHFGPQERKRGLDVVHQIPPVFTV